MNTYIYSVVSFKDLSFKMNLRKLHFFSIIYHKELLYILEKYLKFNMQFFIKYI